MPELPEVETVRRQLDEGLCGLRIISVKLLRSGREFPVGQDFGDALTGRTIERIERRAKLLIWKFENGTAMTAHLKMTGRFMFVDAMYQAQKHDRVVFSLEAGRVKEGQGEIVRHVVWSDIRQFGFVKIVSAEELKAVLSVYGPEPLEHSAADLAARFESPKTRMIKAALLNQEVIAGVGNIYADEALHRAGIRPTRRLARMTQADRVRLAMAVQSILRESIAQQGTSANDYVDTRGEKGGFLELLRVYGREGKPCKQCGTAITRIVLNQRGTHFCSSCQW